MIKEKYCLSGNLVLESKSVDSHVHVKAVNKQYIVKLLFQLPLCIALLYPSSWNALRRQFCSIWEIILMLTKYFVLNCIIDCEDLILANLCVKLLNNCNIPPGGLILKIQL